MTSKKILFENWKGKMKLFFIDQEKNAQVRAYVAVKTTYFTQYLRYLLNPKGEDSSCKIDGFMGT